MKLFRVKHEAEEPGPATPTKDERAKQLHAEEVARQTAPDKKCPFCETQIVKVGTLCPHCGKKVN